MGLLGYACFTEINTATMPTCVRHMEPAKAQLGHTGTIAPSVRDLYSLAFLLYQRLAGHTQNSTKTNKHISLGYKLEGYAFENAHNTGVLVF